jgi:hypothetical protein
VQDIGVLALRHRKFPTLPNSEFTRKENSRCLKITTVSMIVLQTRRAFRTENGYLDGVQFWKS